MLSEGGGGVLLFKGGCLFDIFSLKGVLIQGGTLICGNNLSINCILINSNFEKHMHVKSNRIMFRYFGDIMMHCYFSMP